MLDASGHALVHASAAGENHHWSVDVTLRAASEGTYVLVFSATEPATREGFAIDPKDRALSCAAAHSKGCLLAEGGEVVAVTAIGPGGAGVLRGTFDFGAGGWFRLARVEPGLGAPATFEMTLVSEAFSKDEAAYRFTIEQVR